MPIEIEAPQRARGMVHKMIADVAKGCAGEHYEELARDDRFYKRWPKPKAFIAHNWRLYVDIARTILAGMLGNPEIPEKRKELIHGALLLDGVLNPRRMATPEKPRFFLGPT
jgi:hypothetical protein